MVSTYVAAGIATAVLWGISPVFSRRGLADDGTPELLLVIAISTGLVVFSAIMVSIDGVVPFLDRFATFDVRIFVVGGLIGTAIGRLASYTGIQRVGASVNKSVISMNPIFATVIALVVLGEMISLIQLVGIAIVVGGLVVLALSKGGNIAGWTTRDLLVPLAGAVAYGTAGVIRRVGLTTTAAAPLEGVVVELAAALAAILGYLAVRGQLRVTDYRRSTYLWFLATGVVGSIGLLSMYIGLRDGPVAVVVTLAATSTLVTTLLSTVFLRDIERVTSGVVAGAILVFSGVVLVTL